MYWDCSAQGQGNAVCYMFMCGTCTGRPHVVLHVRVHHTAVSILRRRRALRAVASLFGRLLILLLFFKNTIVLVACCVLEL